MAKALLLFLLQLLLSLHGETRLRLLAETKTSLDNSLFCAAALKSHRNPKRSNCRERNDSIYLCAVAVWDRCWVALLGFYGE